MRFSLPLNPLNLKTPLPLLIRPLLFLRSSCCPRFRNASILSAAPRIPPPLRFRGSAATMTTTHSEEDQKQSPVRLEVNEKIHLSETEKKIFDRLLATLRHFNLRTQLRVAGGWVRDKLLGKDCYDIDIAIDDMLGSEFLDKVRDYLSSTGEQAQGLAIIPCNPDQSKHLETARMRLFDLWIDFVNLRCEEYSDNSRIPTMKFGTAEEDAYRRDLTINSLFYNINTGVVEDLTARGIEDLKCGRIVTPLPPKSTFLDDPLRVLRAIRFGARFDFVLDEALMQAAASEEVKKALEDKISKERIGTEIDLMISGNQPVKAVTYICDLTLFGVVFRLPPPFKPRELENCDRLCLACFGASWELIQLLGSCKFNDEQRRLALYSALFIPIRKDTYKDNKGKKVPVVNYIFKDSLKRKSNDAETVINIYGAVKKFLSLIPYLVSDKDIQPDELDWARGFTDLPTTSIVRIATGILLREIKDFWRVALLISLLLYPNDINRDQDPLDLDFQLDKKREMHMKVEKTILELDLDKIWDLKPLVDGRKIMNILELKSGGPLVREWQQKLLAWQLAHPLGTEEECIEWMRHTNSKRIRIE